MNEVPGRLYERLPEWVEVIDCTLRDGEQAPGVWFTIDEKVALAEFLSEAGIDALDAGFPAAVDSDREAMQEMRRRGIRARICATARPVVGDVVAAAAAAADEVFLFMPTSEHRLKETLDVTGDQARLMFSHGAMEVVSRGMILNLVLEDATRARPASLISLVEGLAKEVPVRRVVVCDTVGASHPSAIEHLFGAFFSAFADDIILCPHCHNDFGMAGANTLAAVAAGARAVTCTVNGIGERAGNADLAEVTAAFTHILHVNHNVKPKHLSALSEAVERMSGIHMSAIKPVTGFNVYRHESGIHVDGMLKSSTSYEFLPSSWIGRTTEYVLGKHSGSALIRFLLQRAGRTATHKQLATLLSIVKTTAEKRCKAQHEQMFRQTREAREQVLSGLDPGVIFQAVDVAPEPHGFPGGVVQHIARRAIRS